MAGLMLRMNEEASAGDVDIQCSNKTTHNDGVVLLQAEHGVAWEDP